MTDNANNSLWWVGSSAELCKLFLEQKGRAATIKNYSTGHIYIYLSYSKVKLENALGYPNVKKKMFKKKYYLKEKKNQIVIKTVF